MSATDNRRRKAWAIAPYLHRRGLTVPDILALPYTSRSRKDPTVSALARAAYAEAGVTEAVPHGAGSETWALVTELLEWMAANPGDDRVPVVDRLDDRARWILEGQCQTTTTSPASAVDMTSTTTTSTDVASPMSTPPPECPTGTRPGGRTSVTVGGDFPRHDGAACLGCGAWHRRYGEHGHGALCPPCRTKALGRAG